MPKTPRLCIKLELFVTLRLPVKARADYLATRDYGIIKPEIERATRRVEKALKAVKRLNPGLLGHTSEDTVLETEDYRR
jgi:hypothetical protein